MQVFSQSSRLIPAWLLQILAEEDSWKCPPNPPWQETCYRRLEELPGIKLELAAHSELE